MDKKVTAVCCGAVDYKEADKIITLCSVEEGKISAVVKGCRKQNAKLRTSATPFCFGEYVLAQKGEYYTVIGCTPIEQFVSIVGDVERFYGGNVILDALRNACQEGDNIAPLIVVALKYLKNLAYENYDVTLTIISFLIDFFTECGYGLEFSCCKTCRNKNFIKKYFSFSAGGVVCNICARRDDEPMSAEAWGLLKGISEGIALNVLKSAESVKREALSLLNCYFARLFGKKLNSIIHYLDILKSV